MLENYFGDFQIARLLLQRSLAGLYLIAFVIALNQFPALLGEKGLEPATQFLQHVSFSQAPSLFHWKYSDFLFRVVAWIGIGLSIIALLGVSERGSVWVSMTIWLVMWFLYLSIVNVGQTFYSFGWESMMLEAGFFVAFLGPASLQPSLIPILILRWMFFRVELGSGLIKMKAGGCWHDLSCLFYHHETQPQPNPLSWYFHYLPKSIHQFGVAFSHFVQLIVPFGLFAPQKIAAIAGGLIVSQQLILIVSGNYSFLNWLTVILGITAFSDSILAFLNSWVPSGAVKGGMAYMGTLYALVVATVVLSVQPVMNLFASRQLMNYSYNRYHLVNTYGAFGSVTKKRYEVVMEGTSDLVVTNQTEWQEYEFKGKPTDMKARPPIIAPYHLRLDWMMWFLPFRAQVSERGVRVPGYERWFINFSKKLLEGDKQTLKLLKKNPFETDPPRYVRAKFYHYEYTTAEEKKESGAWWKRRLIGDFLPPVKLSDLP